MSCCYSKEEVKEHKKITYDSILKVKQKKSGKQKEQELEKKKIKRKKRSSIYPIPIQENKKLLEIEHAKKEQFTKEFLKEIIQCGSCSEQFSLGDHALKINCGACNQFFHCNIAGACVGPNCSVILNGEKESLKYCFGCVNPYLKINVLNNGQSLCKTCEIDPTTPKIYLEV